jgi:hypothetical protein
LGNIKTKAAENSVAFFLQHLERLKASLLDNQPKTFIMKRFYLVRSLLMALVFCCAFMACENVNTGSDNNEDDEDVEHINEQEFEASREESLNKLDNYLDSLNARMRVLSDSVNALGASEDSTGTGRYQQAIQTLDSTRLFIREQYGVMQVLNDDDWNTIASMVRNALEQTDAMIAPQDNTGMTNEMENDSVR